MHLLASLARRACTAAHLEVRGDPISDCPALNPGANGCDLAGQLNAENMGELDRNAGDSCADVEIHVIDPYRSHPDQHLAFAGVWSRQFLDPHDRFVSVRGED
jgi:hypothetical protein